MSTKNDMSRYHCMIYSVAYSDGTTRAFMNLAFEHLVYHDDTTRVLTILCGIRLLPNWQLLLSSRYLL